MTITEQIARAKTDLDRAYEAGKVEGMGQGSVDVAHLNDELEQILYGTDTGGKSFYDEFWDGFTDNGARTDYSRAFNHWGSEYIRPSRKIIATSGGSGALTFANNPNLKKVEAKYFDFSQKPFGTDNERSWYYTFQNCPNLEEIEDIGLVPSFRYYGTFNDCPKLHTIAKMRVNEDTAYINPFTSSIVNLTIEGIIGQNGFDTRGCKELSKASIISIINALSTATSGLTVTLSRTAVTSAFGSTNNDEWLKLVATRSNWTIALA